MLAKKQQKDNEIKMKIEYKELLQKRKEELEKAEEESQDGRLSRGRCITCSAKVNSEYLTTCLLCNVRFHTPCLGHSSFATICKVCETRNDH